MSSSQVRVSNDQDWDACSAFLLMGPAVNLCGGTAGLFHLRPGSQMGGEWSSCDAYVICTRCVFDVYKICM